LLKHVVERKCDDYVSQQQKLPSASEQDITALENELAALLQRDYQGDFMRYCIWQRTLADNRLRLQWPAIHDKLRTLFMCGRRQRLTALWWEFQYPSATAIFSARLQKGWSGTLGDRRHRGDGNGVECDLCRYRPVMGKTFEPVPREIVSIKCDGHPKVMGSYKKRQRVSVAISFASPLITT